MIAAGTPARLRRGPDFLLWLELVAAVAAAGLGIGLVTDHRAVRQAAGWRPVPPETARRAAVGALVALHAVRFWIYLQPDHGLKPANL